MPEHQTIEYKESWHDEFLEWICGYANAYGGTLYIMEICNILRLLWTSIPRLSAIMENIFTVLAVQ